MTSKPSFFPVLIASLLSCHGGGPGTSSGPGTSNGPTVCPSLNVTVAVARGEGAVIPLIGKISNGEDYVAFLAGDAAPKVVRLFKNEVSAWSEVEAQSRLTIFIGPWGLLDHADQLSVHCHEPWCTGEIQIMSSEWSLSLTLGRDNTPWAALYTRAGSDGLETELRAFPPCSPSSTVRGHVPMTTW